MKYNILIIYFYNQFPLRKAESDLLYCFRRYSQHHVYFYNTASGKVPFFLKNINFDLIIYHDMFLLRRWHPAHFKRLQKRISYFQNTKAQTAVLNQDEHIHTEALQDFINKFGVKNIFTVAPLHEISKIYTNIQHDVEYHSVLTGYLDEGTVNIIEKILKRIPQRTIDIGYRAWKALPCLGRKGYLKTQLTEVFKGIAQNMNLKADCSNDSKDTFKGESWLEFLCKCRFTIGVEGGSSILDVDGELYKNTTKYLNEHPDATFEEVEEKLFPNRDGEISYFALSPRHLEACATKTCQILIEGSYNNILQPDLHYIPLKEDMSNLDDIQAILKDETHRLKITTKAYEDIVASGKYTYRSFVTKVFEKCLQNEKPKIKSSGILLLMNKIWERFMWTWIIINWSILKRRVGL